MAEFWQSRTGAPITGKPEDSFQKDFGVIPDGTTAPATIKEFVLTTKEFNGVTNRFYQITWRITTGDFKGREVTQKIKCFDEKPEIVQRALNMLKLIYDTCQFKPSHDGEPTDKDHMPLVGKICGIKIGEWMLPKKEGGFMEGNHVTEVHANSQSFVIETGVKKEPPKTFGSAVESAFSRNQPSYDSAVPPIDLNDVPW